MSARDKAAVRDDLLLLGALPARTVVLDGQGDAWQKHRSQWRPAGSSERYPSIDVAALGPITVLVPGARWVTALDQLDDLDLPVVAAGDGWSELVDEGNIDENVLVPPFLVWPIPAWSPPVESGETQGGEPR